MRYHGSSHSLRHRISCIWTIERKFSRLNRIRVLWVTNVLMPEASLLLNEVPTSLGGWMVSSAKGLDKERIELSIASPKKGVSDFRRLNGHKATYFLFQPIGDQGKRAIYCNGVFPKMIKEVEPDIVHIWGTELPHSLAMAHACVASDVKWVVSIQGLVSVIARHALAGLPLRVAYGATFRNILRKDSVIGLQGIYTRRGLYELETLRMAEHAIGRTTWDKACVSQINGDIVYHHCNEILRDQFYEHVWDADKCEKYSIFISQGSSPIKGLHYLLEALPIVLKRFPQAKVYVGGKNPVGADLRSRSRMTYYGKHIRKLIEAIGLEDKVIFTGVLDEIGMRERYLKSNAFVCASVIENSPNSLGEAMILGVPCVAAGVGGIPDMLEHAKEGFLYQYDAPYMLAHYICEIFDDRSVALGLSQRARKRALMTHAREQNSRRLLDIYRSILDSRDFCLGRHPGVGDCLADPKHTHRCQRTPSDQLQ